MSTPIESPAREAALAFLYERINYERWPRIPYPERHFKLDRMGKLLEPLGNPHRQLRVIHIAGTKGKGSTAALVASMLTAAGYRTGVYTSPHLERLEERFAIDGQSCSTEELVDLVTCMRHVLDADSRRSQSAPLRDATFFELTTAMAMLHFVRREVDLAVLEVGLGGRLDSTNVCQPLVTAITSISYDHQRQLGSTLPEIAWEKAGILKPGIPLVCGVREPSAQSVIRARAAELECPLKMVDEHFGYRFRWQELRDEAATAGGSGRAEGRLDYWQRWPEGAAHPVAANPDAANPDAANPDAANPDAANPDAANPDAANPDAKPRGSKMAGAGSGANERQASPGDAGEMVPWRDLRLGLLGEHQALNAAISLAIVDQLHALGWPLGEPARRWGLSEVKCPARVEIVGRSPATIVDAAHNVASCEALVETLRSAFPGRTGTLVFATSEDKDARGMLRVLLPHFRHAILTRYGNNPRCRRPEELMRHAIGVLQEQPQPGTSLAVTGDAMEAWHAARRLTAPEELLCITGSFFLAAELRGVALDAGRRWTREDPVGA